MALVQPQGREAEKGFLEKEGVKAKGKSCWAREQHVQRLGGEEGWGIEVCATSKVNVWLKGRGH